MSHAALKLLSDKEYLAFEREAEERHEYYRGEMFAMSGASFKHNVIEDNLRVLLGTFLKDRKCRSFGSNLRVHIPANTLYTYPDILIVCDEPAFTDDEFDTLLNPSVIIEILSPSTANYDRGTKFDLYREIKSLQEYVLIDSTKVHVVRYTRNAEETWTLSESKNLHDPFYIATIGFDVPIAEIYAGIPDN